MSFRRRLLGVAWLHQEITTGLHNLSNEITVRLISTVNLEVELPVFPTNPAEVPTDAAVFFEGYGSIVLLPLAEKQDVFAFFGTFIHSMDFKLILQAAFATLWTGLA
jgi:hypothetical protein